MKKINIKKIKYSEITSKEIYELLKEKICEAGVSPEYLEKLEKLLERELESAKDTDDYNKNVISESIDKVIKVFTEGGLDKINNGEYLKVNEKLAQLTDHKSHMTDLQESYLDGKYEKFPFSQSVTSEIRSNFILQTSLKDTFKKLMEEFVSLSPNFMSEEDRKLIVNIIKKSESRIFKNTLKFPAPPLGFEQGVLRKLTLDEQKENGLDLSILIDERLDNHDLLALKELVLIMNGKDVSPLSIAPSFFAKYVPEIKEAGYEGVLIVCENNNLKQIKLTKVPNGNIEYSPVLASVQLVFNEILEVELLDRQKEETQVNFKIKKYNKDIFSKEKMYFIVSDGCVAIPSKKTPFNYETYSDNDSKLKSGEVFVYTKNENEEIIQTRTCFVPYDYSRLNVLHQHGSAIYGSNDQSFQSCYSRDTSLTSQFIDSYKDFWSELVQNKVKAYGNAFSPAVIAARLNHFLKEGDKISDPSDIFKEKNYHALNLAMCSVSEQTSFTKHWVLNTLHWKNSGYSMDVYKMIENLCKHEAPLNRRWLLKQYLDDGVGITKEKQATYYIKLAENLEQNKYTESLDILLKITEAKKYVAQGMDFSEALEKLFK